MDEQGITLQRLKDEIIRDQAQQIKALWTGVWCLGGALVAVTITLITMI